LVFVRVANDKVHSRQGRDLFRGPLCVTPRDHDPGIRILAADSADSGAGVLIGAGGHRAGVEDYD
jgi:hypothetical protein